MSIKFSMDKEGNLKRYMEPDQVIAAGYDCELFPLYTKKDMADRWGVSVALVGAWSKRHTDFPKPVTGILANDPVGTGKGGGAGVGGVYSAGEVKRYEQTRGLLRNE